MLPLPYHAPARAWPAARKPSLGSALPQDILSFQGYRASLPRQLLFAALCLLTCGVLFIVSRWFLCLRVALTLTRCPLAQADYVVVTVRRAALAHLCL